MYFLINISENNVLREITEIFSEKVHAAHMDGSFFYAV